MKAFKLLGFFTRLRKNYNRQKAVWLMPLKVFGLADQLACKLLKCFVKSAYAKNNEKISGNTGQITKYIVY